MQPAGVSKSLTRSVNQHRDASKSVDELSYSEFTIHSAVAYRIATPRVEGRVVRRSELLHNGSRANRRSHRPNYSTRFDEISLTGGGPVTVKDSAIGFNVGGRNGVLLH